LPAEEHKALERLAESLPYLGRADALCEARVDDAWQGTDRHRLCGPMDVGESVPTTVEATTLLAPELPLDVEALVQRPVDVRARNLIFPPGTRFVAYERPPEGVLRREPRRRSAPPVTAVRFSVLARALPPETEALALTDRLRGAAVRRLNAVRGHEFGESRLVGRHEDQRRMLGHQHAHYLAVPDDQRRVGDLAVWVPGRLVDDEVAALSGVTNLWAPEGVPGPGTVEIRLTAMGDAATVLDDLVGPAVIWESVTPFVPPRHAKRDWARFVAQEARRELGHRSLPEPAEVTVIDRDWRAFMRYRPSKRFARAYDEAAGQRVAAPGSSDPRTGPPAVFVRVRFDSPVSGPLLLGYLSHFGLGLFRPA
jgi:CRISPR-associated protein Csb2